MASSNTYKEFTELYEVWLYRTDMTKPESSFSCFCRRDLGHVICLSLRDGLMITFCRKRLTERPFTSFSSEKQIILPAITECGSSYQLFSLCKSHIKTKAQQEPMGNGLLGSDKKAAKLGDNAFCLTRCSLTTPSQSF